MHEYQCNTHRCCGNALLVILKKLIDPVMYRKCLLTESVCIESVCIESVCKLHGYNIMYVCMYVCSCPMYTYTQVHVHTIVLFIATDYDVTILLNG